MKRTYPVSLKYLLGAMILFVFALLFTPSIVHAEGSKDLVESDGYRPYTERYGSTTAGQKRRQVLYVEVKAGETVYLGTSVYGASGTPNDSEIHIQYGDGTNEYRQVDSVDADGYIANYAQETAGPNYNGSIANGYKPIAITATAQTAGTWEIDFYSTRMTGQNPTRAVATDPNADFVANQKGGTIAAWDISVYSGNTLKEGRVYTDELFLNMGGNNYHVDMLNSKVYVYTTDQYLYEVDFNGMDPFGFVFYSNNRGLLYRSPSDPTGSYASLYHSVLTRDNQVSGLDEHNILLNNIPYDPTVDETHKIFFNQPDQSIFPYATNMEAGPISDFTFTGDIDINNPPATLDPGIIGASHAGSGGTFSFKYNNAIGNASTYQIKLDFGTDNVVTLSNTLAANNSIFWDGKDAKGNVVTEGVYGSTTGKISLEIKGGEVHFPLIDVENAPKGIKIQRLAPGASTEEVEADLWKVYYNNVNDNPSRFSDGWDPSISSWTAVAGGGNFSVEGISSQDGAMKYGSVNQMHWADSGNQAVLDMWTYLKSNVSLGDTDLKFQILDKPTLVTLKGKKTVTGRDLHSVYQFEVKENGQVVATGTSNLNGDITFTPITYVSSGTHTYEVTEVQGTEKGITYDSHTEQVTVTVVDNAGTLSATVTYPNSQTDGVHFENKYQPLPTSVQLTAKKECTGYALQGGDFAFELHNGNTTAGALIETKENDAEGNITFTPITFTDAGTYEYTIVELNRTSDTNVNYDLVPRHITIEVQDVNGQLEATVSPDNGSIVFHNVYQSRGSASIVARKQLTGRQLAAEEFEFQLYEATSETDDNGTPIGTTQKNDVAGNIKFPAITYANSTDPVGTEYTYYYYIEEITGTLPGVAYDNAKKRVKIVVTKKEEPSQTPGEDPVAYLDAIVTYDDGTGTYTSTPSVFTNTYTPSPVDTGVELTKSLTVDGQTQQPTVNQFTFQMYQDGQAVGTPVGNDANGKVIFPLHYDTVGTYRYSFREIIGTDEGYTYDPSVKELAITVTDVNGQLVATPTWASTGSDYTTFTNTFTTPPATTSVTLEATKQITGRELRDNDFTFNLFECDADGSNERLVGTATNDASGKIRFNLDYPTTNYTPDVPVNHYYHIKEVMPEGATQGSPITYDTTVKNAIVSITKTKTDPSNPNSNVYEYHTQITYPQGNPIFTNTYIPAPAEIEVVLKKVLTSGGVTQTLSDGQFEFHMYEDGVPVGDLVTNDSDGNIIFPLSFDTIGTHTYTFREILGTDEGYTYDTSEKTLTVTVVDNGQGQLVATPVWNQSNGTDDNTFTNTYVTPPESVKATLTATKQINGYQLKGNDFSFSLYECDENGQNEQFIATVSNDASGKISFEDLTYNGSDYAPGATVTHYYHIKENTFALDPYNPFSFDTSVKNAVVTITKTKVAGAGANSNVYDLNAIVSYPDGDVVFTNVYTPGAVNAEITLKKVLTQNGQLLPMASGKFKFQMYENGKAVGDPATNDANGDIKFLVNYTEVGTHKYTFTEISGNEEGFTYDSSTKELTINITDDGNGHLVATQEWKQTADGKDDNVFTNTYTPKKPDEGTPTTTVTPTPTTTVTPTKPNSNNNNSSNNGKGTSAKTGDTAPLYSYLLIALLAGMAIVVVFMTKVRRKGNK